MNNNINLLNIVVAELNLVIAQLAAGKTGSDVSGLLTQAKVDLATATRNITGQNPGGGDDGPG